MNRNRIIWEVPHYKIMASQKTGRMVSELCYPMLMLVSVSTVKLRAQVVHLMVTTTLATLVWVTCINLPSPNIRRDNNSYRATLVSILIFKRLGRAEDKCRAWAWVMLLIIIQGVPNS